MDQLTIRSAKVKDARRIAKIHVETWQSAYRGQVPDAFLDGLSIEKRTEKWHDVLAHSEPRTQVFVAEAENTIVGFCTTCPSRDEDADRYTGELAAIYIDSLSMQKGIGSALLKKALGHLKKQGFHKATLWVLASNQKARAWYQSKGWKVEGKTKIDDRGSFQLQEIRYIVPLSYGK